jgi:hypothetical protein
MVPEHPKGEWVPVPTTPLPQGAARPKKNKAGKHDFVVKTSNRSTTVLKTKSRKAIAKKPRRKR